MSLLHPRFIHKADEFQTILKENSSSKEWLVGPYHLVLSSSEPLRSSEPNNSAGLFLFDFPPHLQVCLNDISIPMTCFDYLNPFIMTPAIRSQIEIFDSTTGRAVFELDCFCLYHGSFQIAEIIDEPFFYPPVYLINYDKMVFARSNRCRFQVVNAIERWITRSQLSFQSLPNFRSELRPPSSFRSDPISAQSSEGEDFLRNIPESLAALWLIQARSILPDLITPNAPEANSSVERLTEELALSQPELTEPATSEEEVD